MTQKTIQHLIDYAENRAEIFKVMIKLDQTIWKIKDGGVRREFLKHMRTMNALLEDYREICEEQEGKNE